MAFSQTKRSGIWVITRPNKSEYGIGDSEHTKTWELAIPKRSKYSYWPDQKDQKMNIRQIDHTKIRVLTRPNRPYYGYWADRTDQNLGIGQTEQDQKMGVGLTKQTAVSILARLATKGQTRPK